MIRISMLPEYPRQCGADRLAAMSLLIQTDSGTPAALRNIAIKRSGDDPTQGRNHLR
jgi:hypothetical protein